MAEQDMTPKAARAFAAYLEMGPVRSLHKLAKNISKTSGTLQGVERQLYTWSTKYKWVELARHADAEQAAERLRKHEQQVDEMNARQWQQARHLQELVYKRLVEMLERGKVSAYALAQLYKSGIDAERMASQGAGERAIVSAQEDGSNVIKMRTVWGTQRLPMPEPAPAPQQQPAAPEPEPTPVQLSQEGELVFKAVFGGSVPDITGDE